MIKRIIYGMILIFIAIIVSSNDVFASTSDNIDQTLVCVVGNDYSDLLEYDGYEIISGKVNFNVEGDYYLTYMNQKTKETINKKVSVINEKRIKDKPYFKISKTNILSSNNNVVDVFEYLGSYYFLEREQINETNINVVITKVQNNKVQYSKVIKENMDGSVSNIFIDDTGIYITGMIYSQKYSYDIYICRASLEGNIENENVIIANDIDVLNGAFTSGDYIYLYGDTKSTDGVYKGIRQKEDSMILKVDKNLLQPEKVNVNSYSMINTFTNGVILNDKIYLVEQYVSIDVETRVKFRVCVYDQDLKLINICNIVNSYMLTPMNLVVTNEEIMFLTYQYNPIIEKYSSCVFKIDKDGNAKLIYEYVEYSNENIRLQEIKINSKNRMLLLFKDINTGGATLMSVENKNIIFILKIDNSDYPIKLKNNGRGFISYDKEIVDISYIILKEDSVIIDGENKQISSKSKIHQDFSIYGNYINEYAYENEDICFCYHKNIYIETEVSIKDKGVYDKNLKIEFNGIGTLNDTSINSGYIIEEEGIYTLDVIGKEGVCKTYKFEVKDLSKTNVDRKIKNRIINFNEIEKEVKTNAKINIENNVETKKKINYYGFLLIPLILILIMIILVMRKKHAK